MIVLHECSCISSMHNLLNEIEKKNLCKTELKPGFTFMFIPAHSSLASFELWYSKVSSCYVPFWAVSTLDYQTPFTQISMFLLQNFVILPVSPHLQNRYSLTLFICHLLSSLLLLLPLFLLLLVLFCLLPVRWWNTPGTATGAMPGVPMSSGQSPSRATPAIYLVSEKHTYMHTHTHTIDLWCLPPTALTFYISSQIGHRSKPSLHAHFQMSTLSRIVNSIMYSCSVHATCGLLPACVHGLTHFIQLFYLRLATSSKFLFQNFILRLPLGLGSNTHSMLPNDHRPPLMCVIHTDPIKQKMASSVSTWFTWSNCSWVVVRVQIRIEH